MAALPVRPSSPASALAARSQGLNQKYGLPKPAPILYGGKPGVPDAVNSRDPYANPQAYIAKVLAGLGTPLDEAGIQAHAQAQLSPLIQALTDSLTRQAQSGTAAIKGYTNSLANALAGYGTQAQNIYGGAQQAQAASDAALAQRLTGGGAQQSQELAGKLASINAPGAVNQAVTQQTGVGVGAGNALYGTGSASLANLIAQGAGAQDYAAKLPKIADLSGVQQVGQLQGQIANKQAEGLSQLQGQIPGIVSSLEGQQQTLRQNRAQTQTQLDKFFSDRAAQQKALKQEAQLAGIKTAATKYAANQKAAATAYAASQKAATAAASGRAKQAQQDRSYNLEYARVYGVNPKTGQPTLAAVKAAQAADAKAAKKKSGLSATAYANLKKQAADQADTFYYGVQPKQHYNAATGSYTDVPGTGVPGIDYPSAVKKLVAKFSISVKDAQLILNDYYAPGERGRPSKPLPKPKPDVGFRSVRIP